MSKKKTENPQGKKFEFNERPLKRFSDKVWLVNFPTACVLGALVFLDNLEPSVAIVSFGCVVMLTIVIMLPYMVNLRNLSDYIKYIAKSDDSSFVPEFTIPEEMNEEAVQIVEAINEMRNIWSSQKQNLQARSLSDAAVLDSLPDPLIMIDELGKITGANLVARDLLGHNVRERDIKHVLVNQDLHKKIDKILQGDSAVETLQFSLPSPWKKTLRAKIETLPWFSKGGSVAVISLYDITNLVEIEKVQADFVSNASHELRTPLSVISGFLETIRGPAKDDEQAKEKFLNIMSEQVSRMSQLVEDLLSLSRIETNNQAFEKTDIGDVIDGIIDGLYQKAKKKEIEIVFNEKDKTPKDFVANEGQINQIFQNIIDNAIKYGNEGSKITVCSELVTDYKKEKSEKETAKRAMKISVHNYGKTIPEDLIPRLTERFFRLEIHQEEKIIGTGLGMSIVKQAIEKHFGKLKITSDDEKGTNFIVYLPILENKEQGDEEKKPSKLDNLTDALPPRKKTI